MSRICSCGDSAELHLVISVERIIQLNEAYAKGFPGIKVDEKDFSSKACC